MAIRDLKFQFSSLKQVTGLFLAAKTIGDVRNLSCYNFLNVGTSHGMILDSRLFHAIIFGGRRYRRTSFDL